MKNWNAPVVEELEIKLTASSGESGTDEKGATWPYLENLATYDSSIWEKLSDDATCTVLIENSASVES